MKNNRKDSEFIKLTQNQILIKKSCSDNKFDFLNIFEVLYFIEISLDILTISIYELFDGFCLFLAQASKLVEGLLRIIDDPESVNAF